MKSYPLIAALSAILASTATQANAGNTNIDLNASISGFSSDPIGIECATASIGESCTTGDTAESVWYIGTADTDGDGSPETRIYAALNDAGNNFSWGPEGVDMPTPNVASASTWDGDGASNTNLMIASGYSVLGAQACRDLGAEWYLPSKDELNLLADNADQIDEAAMGLDTAGNTYQTSTEIDADNMWSQRFSDGLRSPYPKRYGIAVRCVRR